MVVLAPGGPPMSRRVYLSHLDMPKGDFRYWPILLQKSAILVVGLPLRPLEAVSDYSFSHWTLVGV